MPFIGATERITWHTGSCYGVRGERRITGWRDRDVVSRHDNILSKHKYFYNIYTMLVQRRSRWADVV